MGSHDDLHAFLVGSGIQHFSAAEVAPVGKRANGDGPALVMPPSLLWPHIVPTLELLEELRGHVMRPVRVHSGYRDPRYNAAVGGSPKSQHLRFTAIDFSVDGIQPRTLALWLNDHKRAAKLGIGLYKTFVHVDTRGLLGVPAPSRWSVPDVGRWW